MGRELQGGTSCTCPRGEIGIIAKRGSGERTDPNIAIRGERKGTSRLKWSGGRRGSSEIIITMSKNHGEMTF
jgi:hypothetical protein